MIKKINKLQIIRRLVQVSYLILTATLLLVDLKWHMIIVMILMIIGGTFFCGWLCPYGLIQELVVKLARLLKIKKYKVPKSLHKYLIYSRYIVIILMALASVYLMAFDARISFLTLLEGDTLSVVSYVSLVIFLLIALFIDRPFCNYFCMEGAKYGLIGGVRPFSIKRNSDLCIGCKLCDKTCPMNVSISNNKNVRNVQCINCFQCVSNCPKKGDLTYGFLGKDYLPKFSSRKIAFAIDFIRNF